MPSEECAMTALQRIDALRDALGAAMEACDWEAIGELDLACRSELDGLLEQPQEDRGAVMGSLEGLLGLYRQVIEKASNERQALFAQVSHISQAKSAAKVYHLFR